MLPFKVCGRCLRAAGIAPRAEEAGPYVFAINASSRPAHSKLRSSATRIASLARRGSFPAKASLHQRAVTRKAAGLRGYTGPAIKHPLSLFGWSECTPKVHARTSIVFNAEDAERFGQAAESARAVVLSPRITHSKADGAVAPGSLYPP